MREQGKKVAKRIEVLPKLKSIFLDISISLRLSFGQAAQGILVNLLYEHTTTLRSIVRKQ